MTTELDRLAANLTETVDLLRRLEGLGVRAEAATEQVRDELMDRPLSIDPVRKIDVCLYTGGPAGGVVFTYDDDRWGRSFVSAELWHQEWFSPKEYQRLDDAVGEALWDAWCLSERDLNE